MTRPQELIGYRKDIYQRIYEEEERVEGVSLEEIEEDEQDEDEEEEATPTFRRELGLENLERTLSGLERAGVLEYEFLPGKALLQASENSLREHLNAEEVELLRRVGYRGSERGDELDFSRLSWEEAQRLDERLYRLREKRVGLYHYREPLLRIRAGERLQAGYRHWDRERHELEENAKRRLDQVRSYAESARCRVRILLKHLGETFAGCGCCDACGGDKGPWEALDRLDAEELERAYRPRDTLLAFFAWAEDNAWPKEGPYMYLGRTSTLMALRGRHKSQSGSLGRKYTDNRFFGHLSFIKPKELERAFDEALKKGYLEIKDTYEGKPLYGLTEEGRARHGRRMKREAADVGA